MLSKRQFLLAGASVAALVSSGFVRGGAAAGFNGGHAGINTWYPSSQTEMVFIDYIKSAAGNTQGMWFPASSSDTDWMARIDANGVPQSMPSGVGASWSTSQLYIEGIAGATVVLDGAANCTCTLVAQFSGGGLTLTSGTTTSARKEYLITGTPISTIDGVTAGGAIKVNISITAISGTLPGFRLYLKNYESLLSGTDATSVFHPNYLTRVRAFGVHRHMDTLNTNNSRMYDYNYRTKLTDQNWYAGLQKSTWYYGTAVKTFNTYTVPNSIGTPAHGQVFIFYMPARPTFLAYAPGDVTAGATTKFSNVTHGFSGGELVFNNQDATGGGSWTTAFQTRSTVTGLPPVFTVTVTDATTFTINLDSTGFAAPTAPGIDIMPQIQLSDGVTTKRAMRSSVINFFSSEFAGIGATNVSFVYDANYGVFNYIGDLGGYNPGIPFELICLLSNYCKQHPHFNPPFFFTDASWTALATLVKANLLASLIPRFGVGNEIWLTVGNVQSVYAQSEAARRVLNSGVGVTSNTNYHLAYGLRTKEVSALLAAVFGNNASWQMILESQMTGLDTNRTQGNATVQAMAPTGFPANYCDAFATAPYTALIFEGSGSPVSGYPGALDQIDNFNQGGSSRQTAFNWMLAELKNPSTAGYGTNSPFQLNRASVGLVAIMVAQAATMSGFTGRLGTGLYQTHYEGSLQQINQRSFSSSGFPANAPTSGNPVAFNDMMAFWYGFTQSTQAGQYITDHMTAMAAVGVKWPNHYCVGGVWAPPAAATATSYGAWQLNNPNSAALPMWTALSNWNATG